MCSNIHPHASTRPLSHVHKHMHTIYTCVYKHTQIYTQEHASTGTGTACVKRNTHSHTQTQRHAHNSKYHDHCVSTIKARSRKVIIEVCGLESRKAIELVLNPFPHVSIHVIESQGCRWKQVYRLVMR